MFSIIFNVLKMGFHLNKYLGIYSEIKKAEPMTFTIGTKTKTGSTLHTTGRVLSINLWQVVIDGYQVSDPVSENGIFEIKIYSITGVNHHNNPVLTPR